jgi:hypothetical protein
VAELGQLTLAELVDQLRSNIVRNTQIQQQATDELERDRRALNVLREILGENDATLGQMPLSNPDPQPVSVNGDSPRGERAVLLVMSERRDGFWSPSEIHAELEDRGWISPEARHPKAGTEAALSRLVKKGTVSRNAGVYQYLGEPTNKN